MFSYHPEIIKPAFFQCENILSFAIAPRWMTLWKGKSTLQMFSFCLCKGKILSIFSRFFAGFSFHFLLKQTLLINIVPCASTLFSTLKEHEAFEVENVREMGQ